MAWQGIPARSCGRGSDRTAMEDTRRRITAKQMALAGGIRPAAFLAALNRAFQRGELRWHRYGCLWTVTSGSPEHRELQRIIAPMLQRRPWGVRR